MTVAADAELPVIAPPWAAESSTALLHALALQARSMTGADFVGIGIQLDGAGDLSHFAWSSALDLAQDPKATPLELLETVGALGRTPVSTPLSLGSRCFGTLVVALENGSETEGIDPAVLRLLAARASSALAVASFATTVPGHPPEGWFDTIFEQFGEAVLVVDESGSPRFQSSALAGLDVEVQQAAIDRALQSGECSLRLECRLRAAPPGRQVARQSTTPLRVGGRAAGALALFQELPAVPRRADERAALVGHDLRQPLNVITMAVDMAQRKGTAALSEEQRRALDRIAAAAARLEGLIDKVSAS